MLRSNRTERLRVATYPDTDIDPSRPSHTLVRRAAGCMSSRKAVAVIGPWPMVTGGDLQSGVADYLADLLKRSGAEIDVYVIAQRGCDTRSPAPSVHILPAWSEGPSAVVGILRCLRALRPDVVHIHHEFRLYGGAAATYFVLAGLATRRPRPAIATTVHGVVARENVSGGLMGIPNSRCMYRAAWAFLKCTYRLIARISDEIVVHHAHLQQTLLRDYGVRSNVIPLGSTSFTLPPAANRRRPDGPIVMTFGFLASYKRPELILDLAESELLPDHRFVLSVTRNPRVGGGAYDARYNSLRSRAAKLVERVEWYDYLPEDELAHHLGRASALVLPYSECVASTGVGALAFGSGVPLCHSSPLEPIFGASPRMFELDIHSLSAAIVAATDSEVGPTDSPFTSWDEAFEMYCRIWKRLTS